ncbi:MAG: hypothetical protein ISR65_00735 [Bacteriovoracaceae bacterium]|nr:hypothetical protein [Bacteriovoracaceae bacterium]
MIDLVFTICSSYLIEIMSVLLVVGLVFRFASYRSSKKVDAYFASFTTELEKILSVDGNKNSEVDVEDVEGFMSDILEQVLDKLPTRHVRRGTSKKMKKLSSVMGTNNIVTLRDYVKGDKSFLNSIKSEMGAFKSKFPPNYTNLTNRILERDEEWTKLMGVFPIGPISRLIDVLPTVFVVMGIFGTFIGISMALPAIAQMDFQNLDSAGGLLTKFVMSVTYAMKTSIAGILFSLIMTFLNTLAPVNGLRKKTFKMVSNCFELLWLSIHGEQSMERRINDILPVLLKEVKKIRTLSTKKINESSVKKAKGA